MLFHLFCFYEQNIGDILYDGKLINIAQALPGPDLYTILFRYLVKMARNSFASGGTVMKTH